MTSSRIIQIIKIWLSNDHRITASQDYNSAEHLFRLAEDMNAMRDYTGAGILS